MNMAKHLPGTRLKEQTPCPVAWPFQAKSCSQRQSSSALTMAHCKQKKNACSCTGVQKEALEKQLEQLPPPPHVDLSLDQSNVIKP